MRLLLALSLILCLASCKSKKATTDVTESKQEEPAKVDSDSLFATYEKTACFGLCPIFKLTVYKSGLAYYEGIKNVDNIGLYKGNIDVSELDKTLKLAEEIKYFQMEAVYDGNVTDLPSTIYVINKGSRKQVVDRYRGPEELEKLDKLFEQMVLNTTWKKQAAKSESY